MALRSQASKFLVKQDSTKSLDWGNYADENILLKTQYGGKAWADLTDPVIQYVASARPSLMWGRTPLQDFLQGSGRTREVDSNTVKWKMKGTGEHITIALENNHVGNHTPGIQGGDIFLTLDKPFFVVGDTLFTDVAKDIQVRVYEEAMRYGQGFRYRCKLIDRNPNGYMPQELLTPGLKWLKMDATYGEASWDYGSTFFPGMSWIEFESELTDTGKQVKVTNKAHNLNLTVYTCDDNNIPLRKYPPQIISWIEAEFEAQIKWEKELRLFFGRSANKRLIDESSGYEVRIGSGLIEFLEDGNIEDYPVGARRNSGFRMFTDWLTNLWFDKIPPGERSVTIYTGQKGLEQMNDWITAEYGASAITADFNTFIGTGGKTYGGGYKGLVYKTAFFTEVQLFPFGRIRFEHWPILDSEWLNGGVRHPISGAPLSSYEYIILDYGFGSGAGSNIELLTLKNSKMRTYICGTWSPSGPINSVGGTNKAGFVAVNGERAYRLVAAESYGMRIKDISLTAWYRPAVDY